MLSLRKASVLLALGIFALLAAGCGALPFTGQPASGYVFRSGAPLHVALIDETDGPDWSPAILRAIQTYGSATPYLQVDDATPGANIVVRVRRYDDGDPPELPGYVFQPGVGGFAAVYDADGVACNFPPSPLPLGCSGEIARAEIYLNDVIPPGDDIERRRDRLIVHELGHAMGLTRHSPDLDIGQLAQRYGWDIAG